MACQHQIPDTIQVDIWEEWLQSVRKEMVHITGIRLIIANCYIIKTIEALTLLVAV